MPRKRKGVRSLLWTPAKQMRAGWASNKKKRRRKKRSKKRSKKRGW